MVDCNNNPFPGPSLPVVRFVSDVFSDLTCEATDIVLILCLLETYFSRLLLYIYINIYSMGVLDCEVFYLIRSQNV